MNKYIIEALKKIGVKDTDYPYYHVSDHPETPTPEAHEGTKHKDPKGIYFWIKGEKVPVTDDWYRKKYRWDAKLDESKINDIIDPDWNKLLEGVGISLDDLEDWFEEDDPSYNDVLDWRDSGDGEVWPQIVWPILVDYFRDGTKFAKYLLNKGIKALKDEDGSVIFYGEPQVMVLDPSIIKWGPREKNVSDEKIYRT